jgi:hypothetical protein
MRIDALEPLTLEELRLCKVAVIRAIDSLAIDETQLGAQLTALYARLRQLGGAPMKPPHCEVREDILQAWRDAVARLTWLR